MTKSEIYKEFISTCPLRSIETWKASKEPDTIYIFLKYRMYDNKVIKVERIRKGFFKIKRCSPDEWVKAL